MFDPDMAGLPPITSPTEEPMIGVQAKAGPPRTGMFGVKGTFRDILGTLGDAFLVQAGHKPGYAAQRDKERFADALGGFFSEDDSQKLAALETAARNFPEETAELWKQYTQTSADAGLKKARNLELGYNRAGAFAGAALRGGAEAWARNRPILEGLKQTYGLEDIDIPEQYDEETLNIIANGGMTRYQQQRATQLGDDTASKIAAREAAKKVAEEKLGLTKADTGSKIQTRAATVETGRKNADTNANRAATYAKGTQARIDNPPAKKGGAAKPAVKEGEVRIVNGKKYQIKDGKPVLVQ